MEKIILTSRAESRELYGSLCLPKGDPVAIVQIVHGMAEHKERYFAFMEHLAEHGIASLIFDTRGHGESILSKDELGYMEGGYPALRRDLLAICDFIKERFPSLPYVLMGHSMGSLEVRRFAEEYDQLIDRLIVCGSPSSNPAAGAGILLADLIGLFKGKKHPSPFLDKMAFSSYGPNFSWLSTVEESNEAYRNDPLCGFCFTAGGFGTLFRLMRDVYRPGLWNVKHKTMPVLFIAGEKDPCIVSPKKFHDAVRFMKDMGYRDVRSILYPEMRHEILNEADKESVYRDVVSFVLEACPAPVETVEE
ncbi:MAG: alpha/beta fold hydrolase [Clostridia bacterium]|nr:alpha/beta fold hydrolase [Clostridia bacterium]